MCITGNLIQNAFLGMCRVAWFHSRNTGSTRILLTKDTAESLVQASDTSRYRRCLVLWICPDSIINKLQRALIWAHCSGYSCVPREQRRLFSFCSQRLALVTSGSGGRRQYLIHPRHQHHQESCLTVSAIMDPHRPLLGTRACGTDAFLIISQAVGLSSNLSLYPPLCLFANIKIR